MARTTYYVSPSGNEWKVTLEGGHLLGTHKTKEAAIDDARRWAKANPPSQVMVQKQDGTFQVEWTYGQDPFPPRG